MSSFIPRFEKQVAKLKTPEMTKIMFLKDLASDHRDRAQDIVQVLLRQLTSVHPNERLAKLYLLDCLCKKLKDVYSPVVEPHIVKLVEATFEGGNFEMRKSLHKLQKTWTDASTFTSATLQTIDRVLGPITGPSMPALEKRSLEVNHSASQPKRPKLVHNVKLSQWETLARLFSQLSTSIGKHNARTIDQCIGLLGDIERNPRDSPFRSLANMHRLLSQLHDQNPSRFVHTQFAPETVAALTKMMLDTGMPPPPDFMRTAPVIEQRVRESSPVVPKARVPTVASINFTPDGLKRPNPDCLYRVYKKYDLQCTTCGMRFPDKESLEVDLDYHFKMNQKTQQREQLGGSRSWFVSEEEWVDLKNQDDSSTNTLLDKSESMELEEPTEITSVPASEEYKTCMVCGEKFQEIWDDDADAWIYPNAIERLDSDGEMIGIAHKACVELK